MRRRHADIRTFLATQLNADVAERIDMNGAATVIQAAARGMLHRRLPALEVGHVRMKVMWPARKRGVLHMFSMLRSHFRLEIDEHVVPFIKSIAPDVEITCSAKSWGGITPNEERRDRGVNRLQEYETPAEMGMQHGETVWIQRDCNL